MAIGACLTMGAIQLQVGLRSKPGTAHLLFALNAFVVAVYACFEMALTRADTSGSYLALLRWLDIMSGLQVVTTAAFVWVFFGTGRKWLGLLGPGLTCLALIADLMPQPKLVYLELTGIRKVPTFGGASYTVADGVHNPLNFVFYLGVLSLVLFVADASFALWKRGERRRAAVVGGAITFFTLFACVQAALVDNGILRTPYLLGFAYLVILVAMGLELSEDTLRAARLARDLLESERRMELAAEAASLGVWVRDLKCEEIWASAQWRGMFGYTSSEPLAFSGIMKKVHPEDREVVERTLATVVENGGTYETEYRILLPDGRERHIASRARVEYDGGGRAVLMRGVSLDITARKNSEQEIIRQRDEVTHLSRVTTLGEISGSLAHELNQPLGAILANAEAAAIHLKSDTPDLVELREILAEIRRDDIRAGQIIHGIRDFLRRRSLALEPLEVNELATESVRLISADAVQRQISIGLEIPPDLPPVMGDRIHIQQVLVNLLVNGMDAVSTCPVASRRMILRVAQSVPDHLEFAVSDAGVGIPPASLDQVFDPFHTSKSGGLGLGLAICRSIIEAHGGSISIENNSDRGATVRFSLRIH